MAKIKEIFKKLFNSAKSKFLRFCSWIWHLLKKAIVWVYEWLKYKLFPRYKLYVSYDKEWENNDDVEYEVKRLIVTKPNYLKFKTDDGIVEIRGNSGLNYRIEEL